MIEYVIPGNIDDRILARSVDIIRSGGLAAHPTDTSWHISCSSSSVKGIEKLKRMKDGARNYLFTLFASDVSQVSELADIDTPQYKVIHRLSPGPYVFVLPARRRLEKLTGMKRKEVGIRIPSDPVSMALIRAAGEPLFSVTASHAMEDQGLWDVEYAEENLFEMGWELDDLEGIDVILDGGEALDKTLTTVLDLTGGEFSVIRQGIGPFEA